MDRRRFIKGAGAVAAVAVLPLPAKSGVFEVTGNLECYFDAPPIVGELIHEAAVMDKWHQYAVTKCKHTWKFYVDGELIAQDILIEADEYRLALFKDLTKAIERLSGDHTASVWAKHPEIAEWTVLDASAASEHGGAP